MEQDHVANAYPKHCQIGVSLFLGFVDSLDKILITFACHGKEVLESSWVWGDGTGSDTFDQLIYGSGIIIERRVDIGIRADDEVHVDL